MIADAGLIGLPNAGKSTLLSRLSRATPEIGDYPFTTKHPNLGLVTIGGERAFVLADLPGLIEGAHSGIGLGHEFLRHVERTRVLVHLVEPLPPDGADPLQNYRTIRRELELYSPALAAKPEIVAVSKAELTGSEEVRERLERELGRPVLAVSAVTGQGLSQLVGAVVEELAQVRRGTARMTPDVVVDVGNTRIKWGRCSAAAVTAVAALPPDDPAAWQEQIAFLGPVRPLAWVLTAFIRSGASAGRLARQRGDRFRVIDSVRQLPLESWSNTREGRHRSPAQRRRGQQLAALRRAGRHHRRGVGRYRRSRGPRRRPSAAARSCRGCG